MLTYMKDGVKYIMSEEEEAKTRAAWAKAEAESAALEALSQPTVEDLQKQLADLAAQLVALQK